MLGMMPDTEKAETQNIVTDRNLASKNIPFHSFPFPLRALVLFFCFVLFLLTSCVTLSRK